jgi:hypothetical protein
LADLRDVNQPRWAQRQLLLKPDVCLDYSQKSDDCPQVLAAI